MSVDNILLRIRSYIVENHIPKLKISKMSGVSEATIRGIFKDNANPRISTVRRLESIIPDNYKAK